MKYVSTRGEAPAVCFSEALVRGLAPDGGLYVPETFPRFAPAAYAAAATPVQVAERFLAPFLEGDALADDLGEICREALDLPLPHAALADGTEVLELFHGPTAAFKDFGARFLASCLERLLALEHPSLAGATSVTILVATSGDTGGAVAAAFHRRSALRVGVLFPAEGVSPRQQHHLTCWDENVHSFSVRGTFDDCQRLVKQAFREADPNGPRLSSANSINIGRLLPQAAYYAASSLLYERRRGTPPGYVIPSGNLGNAVGAFWAKRVGFPIARIALACNANRTVPEWFETAAWRPRPSRSTLANAMDVGDPSNMERLFHLYPRREDLLRDGLAEAVLDATIREVIAEGPRRWGKVWCPHTATAVFLRQRLTGPAWIVVATAHPAKFDSIVEPLIGATLEVPGPLAELLRRPRRCAEIDAELIAFRQAMPGLCPFQSL